MAAIPIYSKLNPAGGALCDAADVSFANAGTGLAATDVQTAISELAAALAALQSSAVMRSNFSYDGSTDTLDINIT